NHVTLLLHSMHSVAGLWTTTTLPLGERASELHVHLHLHYSSHPPSGGSALLTSHQPLCARIQGQAQEGYLLQPLCSPSSMDCL
ncbi:hypothetical protein EDD22DRAFT_857311, partial [Suillus occidentalis]